MGSTVDIPATGPVRLGLLGFGWVAERVHLPIIRGARDLALVAVAERDPVRRSVLEKTARGLQCHERFESLLADPEIEAVLVALPTGEHARATSASFEAGKHVYLEKPLALTVGSGLHVIEAWERAGTTGAIGYNFRRSPITLDAQRRLASGHLGDLLGIQGSFHWPAEQIEGWRADPDEGGGVLLDLISHHVDLAHLLAGTPIVEVRCSVRSIRTAQDYAVVDGRTSGGVSVQLSASYVAGTQVNRLELIGSEGALRVDLLDARPRGVERRPGRGTRLLRGFRALDELHPARLLRSPGREPSFSASVKAFGRAVRRRASFFPDLYDGLASLAVVEAALESVREGGGPMPVDQSRVFRRE